MEEIEKLQEQIKALKKQDKALDKIKVFDSPETKTERKKIQNKIAEYEKQITEINKKKASESGSNKKVLPSHLTGESSGVMTSNTSSNIPALALSDEEKKKAGVNAEIGKAGAVASFGGADSAMVEKAMKEKADELKASSEGFKTALTEESTAQDKADLTTQEQSLNKVEPKNPNLKAMDDARQEIHDKAVEDKIELEPEIKKYMEQAESLIDPNYIQNIPKSLWRDFARGDFGRTKIDPELKEEYDKIKKLDQSKLTDEQKATMKKYKEQKAERSDTRWRFGNMVLDAISSGLINIGSYIGGGGPVASSQYEEMAKSKLRSGLERYNKKYTDMANMDTSLLNSAYQNDREIDEQLKKVYADKSVQPYLTKLDLDTRRIFVNYVAAMGKNLKISDLPGLMAGLWAFQDTGNINKSTMDILEKAGSGVLDLVKTLVPGE